MSSGTENRRPGERHDWRFAVPTEQLAEAAAKELAYHRARQAYWAEEADKVEGRIRELGVELREYSATGGPRFDVQVPDREARRLNEARQRRDAHRNEADAYEAWLQLLELVDAPRTLFVDADDVRYFRLGYPRRPSEDLPPEEGD